MSKDILIDLLNKTKIILISIKDDPICIGLLSVIFLIISLFIIVIKTTNDDIKNFS